MPRPQPLSPDLRRNRAAGVPLVAALAAALGGGCTIYDCPTVYEPRAVVIDEAPPPVWERVAEAPEKPRGDAMWIEGYWDWQGQWIWVEGHWETGRGGQVWTEPRVVRVPGGYEYHPGYWRSQEVAPSPTYRTEGDVRVTARYEARASVSTAGGETGDRGAVRTQQGGNTTTAGGETGGSGGDASRRQIREGDAQERPRTSSTASDEVRTGGQMAPGGTTSAGGGTSTGGGTARPTRPSTTAPNQTATATLPPSQATTTTRPPSQSATTTAPPPDRATTTTRPGGTPTTATGAGGNGPGTVVGDTGGGATGDTPVLDAEVRGVAAGPLTCRVEAFTVIGGGYMNVAFETPPRGVPEIVIGQRPTAIVAQQNNYQRVRITVPRIGGTYSVIAVDEQGRRGDCGQLRVILR